MDEEDSQDELINRNASHGKGKRPATSILSDYEDNSDEGEESGEEETDSEDEDEGDNPDVEDDEDEEDEDEDDSDVEDGGKELEGAVGGTSADLAGLSSDEDSEKCPICLNSFHEQPVATPESCEHYFCLDCIVEWSKNANSCPVDRIIFKTICLRTCFGGKVQKVITVQKPVKVGQEEPVDLELEQTSCEVCGGSDREDRLLLCDGCDAGYHMECLTPPLDTVPVEEWFCPECAANNRNSRPGPASGEEFVFGPRPTTSRSLPSASRPTRAIARTQQSERVRASVNRHRITQARTEEFTPRYQIQSTWLDDTISAVVAGLSTAVYVRDLTPRPPVRKRRRRTVKRRTTKGGKGCDSDGKKAAGARGTKRKRRVRRTKSRRKQVAKKRPTSRKRIARSLGIKNPKKGTSIPSVYRPSETTLGSMRADIGAASLSIYGDPFDLDDAEEEEPAPARPSLLELKRRGLSRSAMRSHQPVARPVAAGLSRRGVGMSQGGEVAEAAPVSDLLGSIMSSQNVLMMDSSDVVINRDGTLKAIKPVNVPSPKSTPTHSGGVSEAASTPTYGEAGSSPFPHHSPGPILPPLIPASPGLPSPSSVTQSSPHPPGLPRPGSSQALGTSPGPSHLRQSSRERADRQREDGSARKVPPKPVWVDVSVLPRIPKIKRESGSQAESSSTSSSSSSSSSSSNSSNRRSSSRSNGFPEALHSLTGNQVRQQTADQQGAGSRQQGRTTEAPKQRPEQVASSSSFTSMYSSSAGSSSTSSFSSASSSGASSSSSSSSSVSFRINASGSSWQARRLAGPNPLDPTQQEDPKKQQGKHTFLLKPHSKDTSVKPDVYDPSDPTNSNTESDSDSEKPRGPASVGFWLKKPRLLHKEAAKEEGTCPVKIETLEPVSVRKEPESDEDAHNQEDVLPNTQSVYEIPGSHVLLLEPPQVINCRNTEKASSPASSQVKEEHPEHTSLPSSSSTSSSSSSSSSTSDSSTSQSHTSDQEVKTEVKSEPEDGSHPNRFRSPSRSHRAEQDLPQPPASSSSKEKKRGGKSGSHSPAPKALEQSKRHLHTRSRSRSRDKRRSRSRSRDKRRSHSRSRSRSREKRRSRSRSHSRSRDKRRSRSREKRRIRSRSHSRSRDKRRSRSKEKRRSRSHSRSREKRRSRSNSEERRRRPRRDSRDRNDSRVNLSPKRSKNRRHSRSRSRSKDRKRPRSRSRSRERRKGELSSQSSHLKDKGLNKKPSSSASASASSSSLPSVSSSRDHRKPAQVSNKRITSTGTAKVEKAAKDLKQDILVSVKKETDTQNVSPGVLWMVKEKDPKEPDSKPCLALLKEIKQEKPWSPHVAESKQEDVFFPNAFKLDLQDQKEIKDEKIPPTRPSDLKPGKSSLDDCKATSASVQVEMKKSVQSARVAKSESIWPEEDLWPPPPPPPPPATVTPEHSLSLQKSPPPLTTTTTISPSPPPEPEHQMAVKMDLVKQEEELSADEDFNVDYMLDSLYLKDMGEQAGAEEDEAGATEEALSVKQEGHDPVTQVTEKQEVGGLEKQETEGAVSLEGSKSKTSVKRVTWNIQEPEGPQGQKISKLALYKRKQKLEAARKAANATDIPQMPNQETIGARASSTGSLTQEEAPGTGQGVSAAGDTDKDMYMKKLHMQERAVEEVKLAIKPFYQNRDITKEEYKEILRKAVQKVCHSKSGEINPVKVANLVKAYVDKYKHARKHRKSDEGVSSESGVGTEQPEATDS